MMTHLLEPAVIMAAAGLIAIIVVAGALLRGWQDWLALKRQELERAGHRPSSDEGSTIGTVRIELADLKERIRKLEAIASGVEL